MGEAGAAAAGSGLWTTPLELLKSCWSLLEKYSNHVGGLSSSPQQRRRLPPGCV